MTGTGNPGAAINMIRKKADSKPFVGNLTASYGSWDNQRYFADLSGPLNDSVSLRGRVVTGYQDQDSWVDRYHKRRKFLYATVAADITDNTTFDVGYDYQTRDMDGPSSPSGADYQPGTVMAPVFSTTVEIIRQQTGRITIFCHARSSLT